LSWNIEGLVNKISSDLVNFLGQFHIFGLQETWDAEPDVKFYSSYFPNYTIFFCKAKRSLVGGRSMGGVIVFVHTIVEKLVTRICPNFEYGVLLRIDKSMLSLDTDCLYASLYIPPINSPSYSNSVFRGFEVFEEVLISSNLLNMYLIINGDLNARTGKGEDFVNFQDNVPVLSEYGDILENDIGIKRSNNDEIVNKNGRTLLTFCKTNRCYIANGRFGKDANKGEFTFVNENGCSTIDYFILSKDLLSLITDFEVISEVESSHLPVYLKLKSFVNISLTEQNYGHTPDSIVKYNIDIRNSDAYFQTLYENIENGCFDEFEKELHNPESSTDKVLSIFENTVMNCSEKFKKSKKNKNFKPNRDWYDKQCKLKKLSVRANHRAFRLSRNVNDLNIYLTSKKDYKYLCRDKKRSYYQEITKRIEDSIHNSKNFWYELKHIVNKPSVQNNISLSAWHEHFKSLFAISRTTDETDHIDPDTERMQAPITDDFNSELFDSCITDKEILDAVDQLDIKKSASGHISPNQIKFGVTALLPFIRQLFNFLFCNGVFPNSWAQFTIVPLHKKGNIHDPNNYRGIALLDVLSKLYISILSKRLTFYIEAYSKLTESQAGFRSGYSTTDNMFVLYSLISKYLNRKQRTLYVAFIDFEKAFDTVDRTILFNTLEKYGISGRLLQAIKSIYQVVQAKVRANGQYTDEFPCPVGLRQGCPLSPVLFSIFINELYNTLLSEGIRGIQIFPEIIEIFMLLFADDIALISDTISGLQGQLNVLKNFCDRTKLRVNIGKTKIVVFKRGGHLSRREIWHYNDTNIDTVNGFTYVGALFTNRMSLYKMSEAVSIKAKTVLNFILNSLSKLPCTPVNTFMKIFDVKVCPILLYGSELWGLKPMNCLESVQVYACKRFLNIPNNTSNDAVLGDLGRYPLAIYSAKRCINYWLRILKLPRYRYVRLCYEMLLHYDSIGHTNWVTYLRQHLFTNGFGFAWLQQSVGNEKLFISNYVERMKNQHIQTWSMHCNENSKLRSYTQFKSIFGREMYINIIDISKFRTALAKFRCSSHNLMIEYGRYFNIPVEDRHCVYCETCIEDEYHFLMQCPLYSDLRYKYIDNRFTDIMCTNNFIRLINCNDETQLKNLAMFIYYALESRNGFLLGRF